MLPAAARLRRHADFARTVRDGRRARRGALVLHLVSAPAGEAALPEAGPGGPAMGGVPTGGPEPVPAGTAAVATRVGFVVSRRVGTAVTRNLVLRRLRHLVRERLDRLPAGTMLVVRALPTAAVAGYDQLGRDLDKGLERLIGGLA